LDLEQKHIAIQTSLKVDLLLELVVGDIEEAYILLGVALELEGIHIVVVVEIVVGLERLNILVVEIVVELERLNILVA
jgi:hypothetical protein